MKRSEIRLYERAMRMRWNIPDEYKQAVVRRMVAIVADQTTTNREATAAGRVIISAEAQNQTDEHEIERTESADESRNRFLEVANRLGIGTNVGRTVDGRTTDSDTTHDARTIRDGRTNKPSEADGEEAGGDS